MKDRFLFLKSTRFWVMVVGAVVLYLNNKGYIGMHETTLVETVAALFVGIRTLDRLGEKIGKK